MLTRADIAPLSIAAVTAVAAGVLLGVWAGPPAYLAEPVVRAEAQAVLGDDPNRVRYDQMIAEQGGPGPLYSAAAYAAAPTEPTEADPGAALDARIDSDTAALDAHDQASPMVQPVALTQAAPVVVPVEPEAATSDQAANGN